MVGLVNNCAALPAMSEGEPSLLLIPSSEFHHHTHSPTSSTPTLTHHLSPLPILTATHHSPNHDCFLDKMAMIMIKRRTKGHATKARHGRRRGMGEEVTSGAQSRRHAACNARGNFSDSQLSNFFASSLTLALATPSLHLAVYTIAAWKPSRSDGGSGRRGRC